MTPSVALAVLCGVGVAVGVMAIVYALIGVPVPVLDRVGVAGQHAAAPAPQPLPTAAAAANKAPVEKHLRWHLFDVFKRGMVPHGHKLPSDTAGGTGTGRDNVDDDDDDDGAIVSNKPAAAASTVAPTSSAPATSSGREMRWQTKAFCLESLAALLVAVRESSLSHEFDVAYARRHSRYPLQFVVDQLVDLLTVTCSATSSGFDSLRIRGTLAMIDIVQAFQDVSAGDADADDDVDGGGLLLYNHNALVSSALSQSLKNKSESIASAPHLRASACDLAVVYLTSGVTSEELVLQRILKLLLQPLQQPRLVHHWYAQYDGNMATLVLIAHLSALARLQSASYEYARSGSAVSREQRKTAKSMALETIHNALAIHFDWLNDRYVHALQDFALVSIVAKKDLSKSRGTFFDGATCTGVHDIFAAQWHRLLAVVATSFTANKTNAKTPTSQPLLLFGLVLLHLHAVFTAEILSANRRRSSSDSLHVSAGDRDREQKQVIACLTALPNILRAYFSHAEPESYHDAVGIADLIADLLPLIVWAIQRRASVDAAIIQPRQEAATAALTALMSELTAVISAKADLASASVSMAQLLHATGEVISGAVYQFVSSNAAALSLSDTVVAQFVSGIMPKYTRCWAEFHRSDNGTASAPTSPRVRSPTSLPASVHVAAVIHIALDVMRHADEQLTVLCGHAIRTSIVSAAHVAAAIPATELARVIAAEIQRSDDADKKITLLTASWPLIVLAPQAMDAFAGAINQLIGAALAAGNINRLSEDVYNVEPFAATALADLFRSAVQTLTAKTLRHVLVAMKSADADGMSAFLKLVTSAVDAVDTVDSKRALLDVILPFFISLLDRDAVCELVLASITSLAAEFPSRFKQIVSRMSAEQRNAFQSRVIAYQSHVTAAAAAAAQQQDSDGRRSAKGKKSKKSQNENGAIKLSTNFAGFNKKPT